MVVASLIDVSSLFSLFIKGSLCEFYWNEILKSTFSDAGLFKRFWYPEKDIDIELPAGIDFKTVSLRSLITVKTSSWLVLTKKLQQSS